MPICPKCGTRVSNKRSDGNYWCKRCGCLPRGRPIDRSGFTLKEREPMTCISDTIIATFFNILRDGEIPQELHITKSVYATIVQENKKQLVVDVPGFANSFLGLPITIKKEGEIEDPGWKIITEKN